MTAPSLLDGISRLGAAVSGGSDSIALVLHLLPLCRARGIALLVLCFDHAIAGENSAVETAFVRDFAASLGLPFHTERADPPVAASPGVSLEMAARNARRAFFLRARDALHLDAIATGHQKTDVAETLLLRLLRGSGAAGLSGLREESTISDGAAPPLRVIRPLLRLRRDELKAELSAQGVAWMDDVSNADTAIRRNRMRLKALPALATAGGIGEAALVEALAQSAEILREEDIFLDDEARRLLGGCADAAGNAVSLSVLRAAPRPLARRALRLWLLEHAGAEAAGFDVVESILDAGGCPVNLPGGRRFAFSGDAGFVEEVPPGEASANAAAAPPPVKLAVPGATRWGAFAITAEPAREIVRERPAFGAWPAVCTLSARAARAAPLVVRGRREGDAMRPFGVAGRQKLQDIFVDGKLPREKRDGHPVVLCGDEIAWVPGYRVAARFAASPGEELIRLTVAPVR